MDTQSDYVNLGLYSWCTLPVPPLMQLVQSSHWRTLLVPPLMQHVKFSQAPSLSRSVFPGRHELPCRCYSLCSLRTPRAFTRPGFPGRHELSRRYYSLCSDDLTHDVPHSTVLLTRSCSKLPRRRLPESPWCVWRAVTRLKTY